MPKGWKVDPHRAYLRERWEQGVRNASRLLLEMQKRGYAGCLTQVKKVVRPWRSEGQERVFVRFETAPGEQAQMDWGHFGNWDGRRMYWANTKAAYRFFGNDRISEANILAGHFAATQERFAASGGFPVLVLHDTTELSYRREDGRAVGILKKVATRYASQGRPQYHTSCGILMHSSLATTYEGLPLGLATIKFWNRDKFHGADALKRRINPTRVPIGNKESICWLGNIRQSTELLKDPARCVHIGDRESDIYELFCLAQQLGTHFLVCTCVDRLAGDGGHTIADAMEQTLLRGLHRVEARNKSGECSTAVLEMRYCRMVVCPPIGKQKEYPKPVLTVIHAKRAIPRQDGRRSTGSCLRICPCVPAKRLSRSSIGMRSDGRSRPSTRS